MNGGLWCYVGMLKVENAFLYFLRAKAFCYFIHSKKSRWRPKRPLLLPRWHTTTAVTSTTDRNYEKKFFVQKSLARTKKFCCKADLHKFLESNNHNFYLNFHCENCGFATGQLWIGVLNGVVDAFIHVFHLRKQRCGIRHGIIIPSFHLQNK